MYEMAIQAGVRACAPEDRPCEMLRRRHLPHLGVVWQRLDVLDLGVSQRGRVTM